MKAPPRDALFTASVAGQAAGLVMLGVATGLSVSMGMAPAHALQLMTALMLGPGTFEEVSVWTLLPGFLAHQLGPTLLWSRAFGLMVAFRRRPWRLPHCLLLGAAAGTIALLTDVYLFMPRVQHQLHARDLWAEHTSVAGSWATHLAFGLALGFCYWRWQGPPPAAAR